MSAWLIFMRDPKIYAIIIIIIIISGAGIAQSV